MKKNIGFISFRIAGTDGVSLETMKWASVIERLGHSCYYLGGELDTPQERSMLDPLLHFTHKEVNEIYLLSFGCQRRSIELTQKIHALREKIKNTLYTFVKKFNIQLLIPENALTIPLNIPLGLALTEFIAETEIPTIAHHHDFFWERKRFLVNCVWDYLRSSYPAHLNAIQHVVINSSGRNQLALRTGISSVLIPNVMEFENPAPSIDDYNKDVRQDLGISQDEFLILQPTRVVQRKGIEHAIELVARLNQSMKKQSVLVISHASGDEGFEYQRRVQDYASMLRIKALFVHDIINDKRDTTKDGRKIYSLQDVYQHADLVTYPSIFEGFGNAFIEAVYFRKPILVNNYSIYSFDIKPKGFQVIEMDDFISSDTIKQTKDVLTNRSIAQRMVEINYQLALQHFSYKNLQDTLCTLIKNVYGISCSS